MKNEMIREKIYEVIDELGIELGENETIRGMDSLTFVNLVVSLEDRFQIVFPMEWLEMSSALTVSFLENIIVDAIQDQKGGAIDE